MPGFGKDGKGQIGYQQTRTALGALAANDVITAAAAVAITEDFRMTKMEVFGFWKDVGDEESIIIGLADAELSDAEIEECIEATPLDRNDHLNLERSHRPVWPVAILTNDNSGNGSRTFSTTVVPRWTFSNADGWKWWAYNPDDAALTTGSELILFQKWFGVWVV